MLFRYGTARTFALARGRSCRADLGRTGQQLVSYHQFVKCFRGLTRSARGVSVRVDGARSLWFEAKGCASCAGAVYENAGTSGEMNATPTILDRIG